MESKWKISRANFNRKRNICGFWVFFVFCFFVFLLRIFKDVACKCTVKERERERETFSGVERAKKVEEKRGKEEGEEKGRDP